MSIKSHVSFQKIVQKRMTEQEWEQVINSVENSDEIMFYNIN